MSPEDQDVPESAPPSSPASPSPEAKKKTKKKKKKKKSTARLGKTGKRLKRAPFKIAGEVVPAGTRRLVELPVTRLYTSGDVVIPVHVLHGKRDGPRLFVSAAIHGDEINGVEAIRRLLKLRMLDQLRGTLVAIPVVNVHGFLAKDRYTPDRRDLNRSFPGLAKGSLAGRVAKTFMKEVVARCTHGIDLHTGSNHRTNLPHVRANLANPETRRLAEAFGSPVILDAKLRDGSLRQAAMEQGIPMLLFEGGEALRFDRVVTKSAVGGVLSVMAALGMIPPRRPQPESFVAESTKWIRAPESGLLISELPVGAAVTAGQKIGFVSDPFGQVETPILATDAGIVIGRLNLPLVNEGDALFHVAHGSKGDNLGEVEAAIQDFEEDLDPQTPFGASTIGDHAD